MPNFIRRFIPVFFALVCAAVSSCAYYNEKTPGDPSTITAQNVSWEKVSNEFFQPRCAICHSDGAGNLDVTNYNNVLADKSRILQDTYYRSRMPPDSPLTDYEKKLIYTWINANLPYTATGLTQ